MTPSLSSLSKALCEELKVRINWYKELVLNNHDSEEKTKTLQDFLLSSHRQLIEAGILRKKGMMKEVENARNNYDGNDLESACKYHKIGALDWCEILRYEDGQRKAIQEDIDYLESELNKID